MRSNDENQKPYNGYDNYGARKTTRIMEAIRKTCYAGIGWSVFAFVFVSIFAKPIIQSLTGTNDRLVVANAVMNLKISVAEPMS